MATSYVFFSFAGDRDCLVQAIRSIRAFDPTGKIAVFDDGNDPMRNPPQVDLYERSHWERNYNLNGRECIMGELLSFQKAARMCGAEWVVKMDSDTILTDPDRALHIMQNERLDLCGSTWPGSETAWGPFYMLRASIVPRMMETVSAIAELSDEEDKGMTAVCRAARGRVKLIDFKDDSERWLNGLDYRLPQFDPRLFLPSDEALYHTRRVAITCGNRACLSGPNPRDVCARAQKALLDLFLDPVHEGDLPSEFPWTSVMQSHALTATLPEVPASLGESDAFDDTWAANHRAMHP